MCAGEGRPEHQHLPVERILLQDFQHLPVKRKLLQDFLQPKAPRKGEKGRRVCAGEGRPEHRGCEWSRGNPRVSEGKFSGTDDTKNGVEGKAGVC